MTTINQLSAVDSIQSGDQFPVYSSSNGDARKASASVVLAYIQDNITAAADSFPQYVTQYSAPGATGFTVAVNAGSDGTSNVWLILTPAAGYAAGTITLPAAASCVDKQEVSVNCTQAVTTLTVSANGATAVYGAPTTLAANAFFRMRFDDATNNWYRVG